MAFRSILSCTVLLALASCAQAPPVDSGFILDRPAELRQQCSIASPLLDHAPLGWYLERPSVAALADGSIVLARVEADPPGPTARTRLLVSTLDPTGLGPGLEIPADASQVFSPVLATAASGWALVWAEGNSVRFARQDGASATAPVVVTSGGARIDVVRIAASGDGFGLMWVMHTSDDFAELWLGRIDAGGALSGAPHNLARSEQPFASFAADLAARGDGMAAIFCDIGARRMSSVAIDASGAVSDPHAIELRAAPDGSRVTESDLALAATPSGYVAAWSDIDLDQDLSTSHSFIRVLPLADDATPRTPIQTLADAEPGLNAIQPRLAMVGDSLAILWARGTMIYACAGCMPDHRLRLALLDPERLVPTSNVLIDIGAQAPSGLVGEAMAVSGSDIGLAFHIEFHVTSDPGSLFLRCEPTP